VSTPHLSCTVQRHVPRAHLAREHHARRQLHLKELFQFGGAFEVDGVRRVVDAAVLQHAPDVRGEHLQRHKLPGGLGARKPKNS
jgi:hypothetical protein